MHSTAVSIGHSNAFSTEFTPGTDSPDVETNPSAGSIPRIHGFGLAVIAFTSLALALAQAFRPERPCAGLEVAAEDGILRVVVEPGGFLGAESGEALPLAFQLRILLEP